jgi:cephalosporin hydroxylase
MTKYLNIEKIRDKFIKIQGSRANKKKSIVIINSLIKNRYTHFFDWMGVPIIQFPSDVIVLQELINKIKPKFIIECGIAHGGMLLFYATVLKALEIKKHKVIGIDVKIRNVNKKRLLKNPLIKNIELIEKSSTENGITNFLEKKYLIKKKDKKIIILDSNHTKEHVLNELNLYSKMLAKGDYIVVMDTVVEFIDRKFNKDKQFDKGNSPFNAVSIFLKKNKNYKIDDYFENKSFLTSARNGFLKKIR